MSEIYLEAEDYLWFVESIQGNVNVAGLVFDDLIEETFDAGHDAYVAWTDLIDDTFGITEDFNPYHLPAINESLVFGEFFGSPLRVAQSILNVMTKAPMTPVKIAHVYVEILHGPDSFWEEVSSELQCHSSYANAVPYYWEWIYESLDIDMTEPQPLPPIYLRLKLLSNDLVNMRHNVIQEYLFNSKCFEYFFIWDRYKWGWKKGISDSLGSADAIREIIGKVADEYILLKENLADNLKAQHIINDVYFTYDRVLNERYWVLTIEDEVIIAESAIWPYAPEMLVQEMIGVSDAIMPEPFFWILANESLVLRDALTYVELLLIEEGMEIGDVALHEWVVRILLAEGFSMEEIVS